MIESWFSPLVEWFGLSSFSTLLLLIIVILLIINLIKG